MLIVSCQLNDIIIMIVDCITLQQISLRHWSGSFSTILYSLDNVGRVTRVGWASLLLLFSVSFLSPTFSNLENLEIMFFENGDAPPKALLYLVTHRSYCVLFGLLAGATWIYLSNSEFCCLKIIVGVTLGL